MTPKQIQIIRSTFGRVYREPDKAAALFYETLFRDAPETRALFKGDMTAQGRKLMDTLNVAVSTLRDMPSLLPILERLGRSHREYGVADRHYGLVGQALISTLERALGPDFTPEARDAWVALYGTVSGVMRDAASTRPA